MNVMRRVAAAVGVPWMNRAAAEAAPAAARAGSASGSVARDRLSIILSSQRVKNVDLKALQADIVDIIKVRTRAAPAARVPTPLTARPAPPASLCRSTCGWKTWPQSTCR